MTSLESAVVGATASSLASLIVYPLDIMKVTVQTRLKPRSDPELGRCVSNLTAANQQEIKTEDNNGLLKLLRNIYETEGFQGFYKGIGASTVSGFVQSFSYFYWYTLVRKHYFRLNLKDGVGRKFNSAEELMLGVIAASVSQLFVNPFNLIATQQQTRNGKESTLGVLDVVKEIYHESESITGFWKGLKVSLLLTINPSITFATYEKLKDVLFPNEAHNTGKELVDSNSALSPAQNFVLGLLSKVVSTVVTQPLIVAKASLQRSGSPFKGIQEVFRYLYNHEGLLAFWKGLGLQVLKGMLVQGLIFMFKGELTKLLRLTLRYIKALQTNKGLRSPLVTLIYR
ncbi:HDL029Wp [Eremothecium sinecaudum]|uniref:HDL029Wp n=1 Tax=Eremothecium sinecaudum TaxID=45286 RepID=A0A109UZ18_9SACH|nr:HDL029Wp [Eremothecium sinecaudum]AMD20715.1 HDL029Wp [Eremothecium sinecaudum]